jgi:hypothetical protein
LRAKDLPADPAPRGRPRTQKGKHDMRSILLWVIGIPIPLILLLAMCSGHL